MSRCFSNSRTILGDTGFTSKILSRALASDCCEQDQHQKDHQRLKGRAPLHSPEPAGVTGNGRTTVASTTAVWRRTNFQVISKPRESPATVPWEVIQMLQAQVPRRRPHQLHGKPPMTRERNPGGKQPERNKRLCPNIAVNDRATVRPNFCARG